MPPITVDVRSYGAAASSHRHDFAQFVLPISGTLEIDIAGSGGRLGLGRAAFIEPGSSHSQMSREANRSLIVDLDAAALPPEVADRLVGRPFVPLTPAANRLIDYMSLMVGTGAASTSTLALWTPLLLDALTPAETARAPARLASLLSRIEQDPGLPWTTETMATRAGVSVSRLHALFRAELDTTPHGWLAETRLRRAREWLSHSDQSIAEIAYRAGFADQSAFTRALRRATGMTPAAYRKQETGTKLR